jgi:hypothetical protein
MLESHLNRETLPISLPLPDHVLAV